MMHASYVCVLFNMVSVIPVADVTLITTRKPFGVRMCEDLCNKYNCGSSFEYDMSILTCHIYDNKKSPNVTQKASYYKGQRDQPEKRQPHRWALTTSSKDINSKDSRLVDRNNSTWSRLLVVPYLTSKPQDVMVYSFLDTSIQTYQYIHEKRVSCVIYIPSLKSIWISTDRYIQSHILNRKDRHIVVKLYRSEVYSMVFDDARGLVFVSRKDFGKSNLILKYTTKGKELCRYTVDSNIPFYITLDRNNKIVFYNTHKQIRFSDYKFNRHGKVNSCKSCHVIAFDAMEKALFFQTEGGLIMKKKTGSTKKLTKITPKSLMFTFRNRNHIIFTRKDKPIIIEIDSATMREKILLKNPRVSYGLLICALD